MASLMRRKPAPRRAKAAPRDTKKQVKRKATPLKPGLSGMRNWAAGHVRAASYSPRQAVKLVGAGVLFLGFIIFSGLALGGFLPDIRFHAGQFTEARLRALGFEVKDIDVQGEGRMPESEVIAAMGISPNDYLFAADLRQAQLRVQSLPWVKDAVIRRLWPDQYVVHIIERQPVALWQDKGRLHVIDDEGRIIETAHAADFARLPLIVGSGGAQHADALYAELAAFPRIAKDVRAIVRVADRRWDLVMTGGDIRIMLPETGVSSALQRLSSMDASHNILNREISIIDLRVSGRMRIVPVSESSRPLYVKGKGSAA